MAAAIALLAILGAALGLNAVYGGVPEVLAHRAALHPRNALIVEVRITLDGPARVFIEYENPQAGQFVTALSEPGREHRIPVVRLRPETAYAYTIGRRGAGGQVAYGPSGEFTTGPLPPELAGLQIRAQGRSSQPLLVTDYKAGRSAWYFFWDETGHIVWYYQPENFGGLKFDERLQTLRQKPNGNLVFLSYRCCLVEITPLGEPVAWIEGSNRTDEPHHDFLILNDERILYLTYAKLDESEPAEAGGGNGATRIDRLHLWNQAEGTTAAVWDPRNLRDAAGAGQGAFKTGHQWHQTHTNSLSFGAGGTLLLSARNRHQIVALSPDFRRVEWQLGGPGSDYEFPNPGDRFYGQHTAAPLPNGHILLFDNGRGRPAAEGGAYSRALELRLNEADGTAVKVWEYRPAPVRYSDLVGSAFRLSGGRTLVNFGGLLADGYYQPLPVIEVDRRGKELFRVELFHLEAAEMSIYRAAAGIASIKGERMLRPPEALPEGGRPPAAGWWWTPLPELDAQLAGQAPAARAAFDLHLHPARRRLVYRRQPCAAGETAAPFFLNIYPARPGDLPEERREYGFENRDFKFNSRGDRWEGKCLAAVPLPAYPIAQIRTGQYVPGGERLWEAELPGHGITEAASAPGK